MKKYDKFVAAVFAAAALAIPVGAQETRRAPDFEFAFGLGAMELDEGRTGIDKGGVGVNVGIRFGSDATPLGVEWRLYGASFSLADNEYSVQDGRGRTYDVYCEDCEYSIAGTDFSLLVNFNHSGVVNPYLGVGFLYEECRFDADVYEGNHYGWRHHPYHDDWEEDGVTYLLRAGLDIRANLVYLRVDAGYIGEIYDIDDKGQFLLTGDLGVYFIPTVPALRADVFGHYFTEYKSFYIGVGVTLAL